MSCAGSRMRGPRVRGGLEGKTGACGRTVTTGSRSPMPYDSAAPRVEEPEEEIGRSELSFTARLSRPTPSELSWFLLSFCTRHKPAVYTQGVYASSLDQAPGQTYDGHSVHGILLIPAMCHYDGRASASGQDGFAPRVRVAARAGLFSQPYLSWPLSRSPRRERLCDTRHWPWEKAWNGPPHAKSA